MTLSDRTLSLSPGVKISLFDVDLTPLGGGMLRFTPAREDVTPDKCTRLSDTSTTIAHYEYVQLPITPIAGDEVVISGYMRPVSGDTTYPRISLSGTISGAAPVSSVSLNLATLVSSYSSLTALSTGTAATVLAMAGEWVYFSIKFVMNTVLPPSLFLVLSPSMGATASFPTTSNVVTGSVDLFGVEVRHVSGGFPMPVILPEIVGGWLGTATSAVVANTAEAVRVPVFGGNAYTPIPIEVTGFEKSGSGPFPRPKMRMSNLFSEGSALAQQYGDLRGAIVTRRQLFADNLDNGPDPDPAAVYPPDIFKIDRKGLQNAKVIEFELASVLDQPGVSLPGRQVLRDVCPFTYRVWNGTGFDYAGEDGCPYNAVAMFDADGNAVINGALDVCSHQLKTGCRARYGRDEETPFGGFPMVGRLRQ